MGLVSPPTDGARRASEKLLVRIADELDLLGIVPVYNDAERIDQLRQIHPFIKVRPNPSKIVTVQSTPNKTPTASPRTAATMASKEETP